jgi:hypothetical protein
MPRQKAGRFPPESLSFSTALPKTDAVLKIQNVFSHRPTAPPRGGLKRQIQSVAFGGALPFDFVRDQAVYTASLTPSRRHRPSKAVVTSGKRDLFDPSLHESDASTQQRLHAVIMFCRLRHCFSASKGQAGHPKPQEGSHPDCGATFSTFDTQLQIFCIFLSYFRALLGYRGSLVESGPTFVATG